MNTMANNATPSKQEHREGWPWLHVGGAARQGLERGIDVECHVITHEGCFPMHANESDAIDLTHRACCDDSDHDDSLNDEHGRWLSSDDQM
jgi:hypothetical protein